MDETIPSQHPVSKRSRFTALLRDRWPEYIMEVLVIVLSISASFALDEWKEKHNKKDLEQLYLKELARDIEADTNQLNEIIAETRQIILRADKLLTSHQMGPLLTPNQLISDIRFTFKRPRFVAQDATFSDLKSTGNLQSISSFSLKNDLFNYYKQYESTVLIEAAELGATNGFIGPYILRELPLAGGSTARQKAQLASMLEDVEFQNSMVLRQTTRQELLQEYSQALQQGKHVLSVIKSQVK